MKKTFTVNSKYLLIPVKNGAPAKKFFVYQDSVQVYEFDIPMAEAEGTYEYDFQGGLPVDAWMGKEIVIEGEFSEAFANAIVEADVIPESGCKKPLLHFAPDTGWLNDPCGLLYQNGVYHLYFQHNPFSVEWGNMTWGHAVSTDLLHWEQKDEAIWPDQYGTIFTGSALVNEQGLFGLPKDAQLYVYTSAGKCSLWSKDQKFVQKLAWSTDNGETLNKVDECILDHIVGDNRDMKVYWHEETKQYYAIMFWENNDYAILNSPDMKNWTVTQKLTIPPAWECPDLVKVQVEGGGSKWVIWTADGFYFVGEFDGSQFTFEGDYKEAYKSMLPYAAQTFNGTERIISVPWLRADNEGKVRRGMMGLPRQLTLVKDGEDYVLRMKPVDEFEAAKEKKMEAVLDADQKHASYAQQETAAVEVVLYPEKGSAFTADIYGTKVVLADGVLTIQGIAERSAGVKQAERLGDKELIPAEHPDWRVQEMKRDVEKIALFSDGEVFEVTVNDGLMGDAYETVVDEKSGAICVEAEGTVKLEIFTVK